MEEHGTAGGAPDRVVDPGRDAEGAPGDIARHREPGEDRGHASGYTVEEDPTGGFRWSVYSPAGTRSGHSPSRAEAEAATRDAQRELDASPGPSSG